MLRGKLDLKTIFILVLGATLIISFIFRPSNKVDEYESEIRQLNLENEKLRTNNDSLVVVNKELDNRLVRNQVMLDSTTVLLEENKERINTLQNGKDKVSGYIKSLDADGVAGSLSDYLNRR